MYTSLGFLRLPRYPMLVDRTMIDFMVDSREARSTIWLHMWLAMWTRNDGFSVWKHVRVRAYHFRKLYCAVEMWDGGGGGRALKHAFLCSETCPVPLMARDLMCKLNLKLTAGPFGSYWRGTADELCKIWATVGIRVADKWFWLGTNDFEIGKDRTVSANTESMLPDRLHLFSVNHNMRKSGLTGQKMFLTRFDKIFWNENVCALSACLSEKQMQLYLITEEVCATLITNQGHWAEMGRLWENAWEP